MMSRARHGLAAACLFMAATVHAQTPPEATSADPATAAVDTAAHRAEAEVLLASGAFAAAERVAEQATVASPMDAAAWKLLGRARLYRGDVDGAVLALGRAVAVTPDATDALVWYGDAPRLGADPRRAKLAYARALKAEPANARALEGMRLATLEQARIQSRPSHRGPDRGHGG